MTIHTPQPGEACTQCGFVHTSTTCPTDAEVCAWYETQSEQWLSALSRHVEGMTPRKAWNFFFRPTPAANTNGESLAALAAGGQGADTVPGNEKRRGRPAVHADAAARKAAHRADLARIDFTDKPEIVAKLKETAEQLDCSVIELLRSMVRFAQCNRNWKQVGLYGSR